MKKSLKPELIELTKQELEKIDGGIIPILLGYALIYASIAVPFYAGWKAYE